MNKESMMHVQVNVTRNCLLEFLDILDQNHCHDICVTYSDYGWHVQYESPFTRYPDKKVDAEPVKEYPTPYSALCCKGCANIKACAATGSSCAYCGGRLYMKDVCGHDPNKCEGVCHG